MQPGASTARLTDGDTTPGILATRAASVLTAGGSALAIFLLSRPYGGIVHDATLYVGRAMADADPDGLGRDILFAHDGQFAFSLYPRLSAPWLHALGPSAGAFTLTLAGLCAWFAALSAFGSTLARGRLLWVCLVVAAVVPGTYSELFGYAEPFATPRLFAEGLVLAGLALLARSRAGAALVTLLAGAALHPIIAAPGLGIWVVFQAWQDRRWLLLPAAAIGLLLCAAAAGLPVAHRALEVIDPAWMTSLSANSYLFPSQWTETTWAGLAVRATTVLLGLRFVGDTQRRILVAMLLVGLLGLLITCIAADHWAVLLITQAQPWRALWLVAFAGALTLPIAAVGLWRRGPVGRTALAMLALAWIVAPTSPLGPACAGLALAAMLARRHFAATITPRVVLAAWAAFGIVAAFDWVRRAVLVGTLWASKPADAAILGQVWPFWLPAIPITVLGIAFALRETWRPSRVAVAAASLALVGLAGLTWDNRSTIDRVIDRYRPDPSLASLLPSGHAEVLWLRSGAKPAWTLAGQRSWVSYLQGAAMVFSRDLALVWQERMERLIAANLGDAGDRSPWTGKRTVLRPSLADITAFCAAPDAPGVLFLPLDGSVLLPDRAEFRTYRLPAPIYEITARGGELGWETTEELAILPCRMPLSSS